MSTSSTCSNDQQFVDRKEEGSKISVWGPHSDVPPPRSWVIRMRINACSVLRQLCFYKIMIYENLNSWEETPCIYF